MELGPQRENTKQEWYAVLSPLDSTMATPVSAGGANGEITSPLDAEDMPPATVREVSAYYDLSTVPSDNRATYYDRVQAHYGLKMDLLQYPGLSEDIARGGVPQFMVHEEAFPDERLMSEPPQEQPFVSDQPEAEPIMDVVPAESTPVPPVRVLPLLDVEIGTGRPYVKENPEDALPATELPEQADPWAHDGPTYTPHERLFPEPDDPSQVRHFR